jgi:hypothetical protein
MNKKPANIESAGFLFLLVVPTGIEPVPSESESEILSIKLKDQLYSF